jgi:hypothetical protein
LAVAALAALPCALAALAFLSLSAMLTRPSALVLAIVFALMPRTDVLLSHVAIPSHV